MDTVHAAGGKVSYDPNLRLKLWSLDKARSVIHQAMSCCDIALPGLDDARLLTGLHEAGDIADFYLQLGAEIVALTLGVAGTLMPHRTGGNRSHPMWLRRWMPQPQAIHLTGPFWRNI